MSQPIPQLTRSSQHRTQPKFTIQGKWRTCRGTSSQVPAANTYDVSGLVDRTSKFRKVAGGGSFSRGPRFGRDPDELKLGPGRYDTANSTLGGLKPTFGQSTRPAINGPAAKSKKSPGPGEYEVRNMTNRSDATLTERGVAQAGRHGWFYDNPQAAQVPGPGAYNPGWTQTESAALTSKQGSSLRPAITSQMGVGKNTVGPGQYPLPSSLGRSSQFTSVPAYSFTSASDRHNSKGPPVDPPYISQPSQFGY